MRIAFIMPLFPKLSETFILNQITGLIDRGHHVSIFAKGNSNEATVHSDVLKYNLLAQTHYLKVPKKKGERVLTGLNLFLQGILRNPKLTFRLLNFFKYGRAALSLNLLHKIGPFLNNFDIIHCHFGPTGNLGVTLRKHGIQAKFVTTFHGFDIRLGQEKGGQIYDSLFSEGDCFIAISDYNYENLVAFGLEQRKIVHLPVGIDISKFPYNKSLEHCRNGNPIRMLTVARLVEEKGLTYGIKAIHELLQQRPQLKLSYSIIGEGPLEENLVSLTQDLGLTDVVNFLGARDQRYVSEILKKSHIFLLPSIAEVLPVSLMEAQAVGLPVIATDVGDIKKIVLDGKSGFVVPSRDVCALAEKLEYMLEHNLERVKMGLTGRKHVADNYDSNKLNDRLVGIYQKLLSP